MTCKHGIQAPPFIDCVQCMLEDFKMSGCVPSLTTVDKTLSKKEMLEYILRIEKQLLILNQMMNVIKEELLK